VETPIPETVEENSYIRRCWRSGDAPTRYDKTVGTRVPSCSCRSSPAWGETGVGVASGYDVVLEAQNGQR
jgi:hypothetical protein